MLCTISAAREVGHETADVPVHLYGPPGIADFLAAAMELSDTYMLVPLIIHEFVAVAVPSQKEDSEVCGLHGDHVPSLGAGPLGWLADSYL